MTQKKINSFNDVTMNRQTKEFILAFLQEEPVDPKKIDTNVLVWNQCLRTVRDKIERIREVG